MLLEPTHHPAVVIVRVVSVGIPMSRLCHTPKIGGSGNLRDQRLDFFGRQKRIVIAMNEQRRGRDPIS